MLQNTKDNQIMLASIQDAKERQARPEQCTAFFTLDHKIVPHVRWMGQFVSMDHNRDDVYAVRRSLARNSYRFG